MERVFFSAAYGSVHIEATHDSRAVRAPAIVHRSHPVAGGKARLGLTHHLDAVDSPRAGRPVVDLERQQVPVGSLRPPTHDVDHGNVLDPAAPIRAQGQGDRYACRNNGHRKCCVGSEIGGAQ